MRCLRFAIAVLSLVAGLPAIASAHAVLRKASPAAGAVLKQSPPEIRLQFNENIEPRFSRIELTAEKGGKIDTGPASPDLQSRSQILVTVPPLAPGTYKVKWLALSVDSHKVQGEFTFQIVP